MNTTMTSGTAANRTSDGISTFGGKRIATVSTLVDKEARCTQQTINRMDVRKTRSDHGISIWTVELTPAIRTIHITLNGHTVSLRIPWQ